MGGYANKVVYGTTVLVDLTEDTVDAGALIDGYTAHAADGSVIVGTLMRREVVPIAYDYEMGYTDRGTWHYQNSTNNHTDVYEIIGGHSYTLALGSTVGTRFRSAQLPSNPVGSMVDIAGTQVVNLNNPKAHALASFAADSDGWLCVTKDNVSTKGLKSWLFDVTTD